MFGTIFQCMKKQNYVFGMCMCVFLKKLTNGPLVGIEERSFMCCLIKWAPCFSKYLQKCH